MAIRTQRRTWTIFALTIAAAILASALGAAEIRRTSSETGEPADLVNRPDCWTDGGYAFDRCILR